MKPLTEIIEFLETRQKAEGTIEGSVLLALAIHVKNLENKIKQMEPPEAL